MPTIGTFNLNNLFSRFNFRGTVADIPSVEGGGITLSFSGDEFRARTFFGRLVREKEPDDTQEVARRIVDVMDVDILAVQEVEHIDILKAFNRDQLGHLYPHIALIEGNDQRLIDVGVMSKLPIGAITSFQTATHPDQPNQRVFGRDLLKVQILDDNEDHLLNVYNTHLKSHFVPFGEDPIQGAIDANERRRRQAETIARILEQEEGVDAKFVLTGDMNDPPDSPFLAPMLDFHGQQLVNALDGVTQTRPSKAETAGQGPGPQNDMWTHRFNPPGPEFPRYELLDHIWVSPALANSVSNPIIDRRTKHGGDGSDHDPAWVTVAD